MRKPPFELQDIERSVRDGLLLERAARTQQREGAPGHGDGERFHLGVGGPRQGVQAQLRVVQQLEDGLGDEHVEVGRQLSAEPKRWTKATAPVRPRGNGGEDTAPSPFQLFLAALGTCAGVFVQGFCAKRRIPYEAIQLIERPTFTPDGGLQSVEFEVRVPPEFPPNYREALRRVIDQCW